MPKDNGYSAHFAIEEVENESPSCFLDPGSNLRLSWDLFGIPVLSWDLVTIPLGVFDIGQLGENILGVADWVTLLYWTFDMPMSFVTGFYDREGNVVSDRHTIFRHYLRGPFGLDCVIVVSDWMSTILEMVGNSAPPFLSNLSIMRVVRITHLRDF
jgi:hypothetical protein